MAVVKYARSTVVEGSPAANTFFVCDTEAEKPASGMMAGDQVFCLDTGNLYLSINATTLVMVGPPSTKSVQETSSDTLGGTEVVCVTTAAIAVAAGQRVLVMAYAELVKDTGTTVRLATMRVRRGTTIAGTLVAEVRTRSQGVASTVYGPAAIMAVDTPGAGSHQYVLTGLVDAGASTAEDKGLVAQAVSA